MRKTAQKMILVLLGFLLILPVTMATVGATSTTGTNDQAKITILFYKDNQPWTSYYYETKSAPELRSTTKSSGRYLLGMNPKKQYVFTATVPYDTYNLFNRVSDFAGKHSAVDKVSVSKTGKRMFRIDYKSVDFSNDQYFSGSDAAGFQGYLFTGKNGVQTLYKGKVRPSMIEGLDIKASHWCHVNGYIVMAVYDKKQISGFPVLSSQPKDTEKYMGNTASFAVKATGPSLTYQWQKSGGSDNTFCNVKNAVNPTYSFVTEGNPYNVEYRCMVSSGNKRVCSVPSLLSVKQSPFISIDADKQKYAIGGKYTFVADYPKASNRTFQWFVSNDGENTWNAVSSASASPSFTLTLMEKHNGSSVRCKVKESGHAFWTLSSPIYVPSYPAIISQPRDKKVTAGNTATFTVGSRSSSCSFQWEKSVDYGKTWKSMGKDYAKSSISFRAASSMADSLYRCKITGNGKTVYSDPALLTIKETKPTIQTNPTAASCIAGNKATFSAAGYGINLCYQWQKSSNGGKTYADLINRNGSVLTFVSALSDNQCLYRCKIYNDKGAVYTTGAKLTVTTPVPKITKQPANCVVGKLGDTGRVTIAATSTSSTDVLKYTWYYKDVSMNAFAKSSIVSSTYQFPVTAARNGRQVYCVVSNRYGKTVKSNVVTMRAKTPLTITEQPQLVTIYKPSIVATFAVYAKGEGLTYTWYAKNTGDKSFSVCKSESTTTKANVLAQKPLAGRDGRQIYCVVKDKYGESVKTKTATLRFGFAQITKQPESANVSQPNVTAATFSITAKGTGLTYTWYAKDVGDRTFKVCKSDPTKTTFGPNVLAVKPLLSRDNRQVYCVVKDKYGNTVKSSTVSLHIGYARITAQPQDAVAVKVTDVLSVKVSAQGDGLKYQWYYKIPGMSGFAKDPAGVSATYKTGVVHPGNKQVYCVVTDKYGNSAKTRTAVLCHILFDYPLAEKNDVDVRSRFGETLSTGNMMSEKEYSKNPFYYYVPIQDSSEPMQHAMYSTMGSGMRECGQFAASASAIDRSVYFDHTLYLCTKEVVPYNTAVVTEFYPADNHNYDYYFYNVSAGRYDGSYIRNEISIGGKTYYLCEKSSPVKVTGVRFKSEKNTGIDLGNRTGESFGMAVHAAASGKVVYSGFNSYGNCVVIDHGHGYYTLYGGLACEIGNGNLSYSNKQSSAPIVKVGDSVQQGQLIGHIGSTYGSEGYSSEPHLHFEIRIGSQGADVWSARPVDPELYIKL